MRRVLLALALTLFGCTEESRLIVDVSTDLAAGVEFDTLSLELAELARRIERPVETAELGQRFLESPLRMQASTPNGTYTAVVALEREGLPVLSLRARVTVAGTTGMSVLLTSSCLGVPCEESAPNCLNGSCLPEGCLTGLEEACAGFSGCRVDTECPPSAVDCLTPACLASGVCAQRESSCGAGEYCDAVSGCQAIPTTITPADAGVDAGADGGFDGGLDAGIDSSVDAGPVDLCDALVGQDCATFAEGYLKANPIEPGQLFGMAVALDGDTLAVGAPGPASSTGAVDVYVRSGSTWTHQARVLAPHGDEADLFGLAVALDGDTLVVGAQGEDSQASGIDGDDTNNDASTSGAVFIFTRAGTLWTQQAYVKASNPDPADNFGASLALEGDTLVVGALGEGSSATGVDGDQSSDQVRSIGSGAAYVFLRSGSAWTQQAYLKASVVEVGAQFGGALALSGDTVAVGAAKGAGGTGVVYVFARTGALWAHEAVLVASNAEAEDDFGASLALEGDTLIVGAPGEDSDADGLGGDESGATAPEAGAAYAFARVGASWTQVAYIKASGSAAGDAFGSALALAGDTLVVGAPEEASAGVDLGADLSGTAERSGAVYLFRRRGGSWAGPVFLKASNTDTGDRFGTEVAIATEASGLTLAVGAAYEESGVRDDESDNSSASGAVYIRRLGL